MPNLHRVAVVQAGSTLFDTARTLERMEAHCQGVAPIFAPLSIPYGEAGCPGLAALRARHAIQ